MFPSIRLNIKHKEKVENGKVFKNLEAVVKTTKKLILFKVQIPELFIYTH